MTQVKVLLETNSSLICAFLADHIPSENSQLSTEGVLYKVEKVVYHCSEVVGTNVPEVGNATLYNPTVELYVSVVP